MLQRGDNLVVNVELANVADGTQIYGGQYAYKVSDVLTVQQRIAKEIADSLRLRLTGAEREQLAKRPTENTEAYQAYLRGQYYFNQDTEESLKKSLDYFNQAILIDPNYALAHTGLARYYAEVSSRSLPPCSTPIPTR